ncbi:MAG: MotA/TolQ/ExbB proton channel family protein [Burkholderia sp.]|jgi:biopolymer transport protein ExbB|uniref:MotA/TolQ/ExbB proton channel family protein n=1 Tax=Burkholderia sp. TaxID=36773 RepID=UPI00281C1121|nr:MotA/TolQ/ExbB proton channel family protein [Burkholderia sp.]MDR0245596.1 MotA/TolQ/ExbB proton channel family protein [Burkholderia sp.]
MQFGLNNIWHQGDIVSQSIALVLLAMSVLSWTVMLAKGIQLVRLKRRGLLVQRRFWEHASIAEAQASLGRPQANDPYTTLVDAAREATAHNFGSNIDAALGPAEWLQRCLSIALHEQQLRLMRGLPLLASVGSTAPFIGLFGTVWGIYHALLAISAAGQTNLSQVAGPVGEALVMTAFGLFVAIPAVLGYNAISRNHREVASRLYRFQHDLQAYFMSGEQIRPVVESVRSPAAPVALNAARSAH